MKVASDMSVNTGYKSNDVNLGHINLMFCFTSKEARKSDSVAQIVFISVTYEYHYKTANELLLHSPSLLPTLG